MPKKLAARLAQIRLVVRYALRRTWTVIAAIALVLLAPIAFREILLFAGSALIGYGLSFIYPPAAWAVPGVILAGVAIFGVRG